MSYTDNIKATFEPLRSLAFGGITDVYAAVGTPISNPIRIIKFTNLTNEDVFITDNLAHDGDIIPSGAAQIIDVQANSIDSNDGSNIYVVPRLTQIYVRRAGAANPTSGAVYVTAMYSR